MIFKGETPEQARLRAMKGVRRFAIFPHQLNSGQWVWLEWFWSAWVPTHSRRGSWSNAMTQKDAIPKRPNAPAPLPR